MSIPKKISKNAFVDSFDPVNGVMTTWDGKKNQKFRVPQYLCKVIIKYGDRRICEARMQLRQAIREGLGF